MLLTAQEEAAPLLALLRAAKCAAVAVAVTHENMGRMLAWKLGGQHAAYLVKALQEYKAGNRTHPTMRAIAAGLSDKDMADLAAYYASDSMKSAAK